MSRSPKRKTMATYRSPSMTVKLPDLLYRGVSVQRSFFCDQVAAVERVG
jgi:hypothetical protein